MTALLMNPQLHCDSPGLLLTDLPKSSGYYGSILRLEYDSAGKITSNHRSKVIKDVIFETVFAFCRDFFNCTFPLCSYIIRTNVPIEVIPMERIDAVIDGKLQAVPVITLNHLMAISKIHTGVSPGCAPDILRDLVEAGLVEETANEFVV